MKYHHQKGVTNNRDWTVIILLYLFIAAMVLATVFGIQAYVYEGQRAPCRDPDMIFNRGTE